MIDVPRDKIVRFQKNLSTLRKVAGWSAEDLSQQLDITRQTVVNLETGQTKMTKVQYLALRLVFATEIQASNNETLQNLLTALVDRDDVSEDTRLSLRKTVDDAVKTVGRRAGSDVASKAAILALEQAKILGKAMSTGFMVAATTTAAVSLLYDLLRCGDN